MTPPALRPSPLQGAKVVVTGVTGQVAGPLAMTLAERNEVYGAARFNNELLRHQLEAADVHCVKVDLANDDVSGLPADADYVLHFAVSKSNDWEIDLAANVGGTASLMAHHREARAFFHCSSAAVYRPEGHRTFVEDDLLGDNHGVWPFLRTYSICKIGAEGVARWAARHYDLPTTIARLSVPYGDRGGWPAVHLEMLLAGHAVPVHVDSPSQFNPLHQDDIAGSIPHLLAAASVPATVVNWGGDEVVSIEEWCAFLAQLAGVPLQLTSTDRTIESVRLDLTKLHTLAPPSRVAWRDGLRAMVEARHPELLGHPS